MLVAHRAFLRRNFRKAVVLGLTGAVAVAIICWSLQPNTRNADARFLRGAQSDFLVRSILMRSCADCHSESTLYPWYARLPWLSGWLQEHVRRGREQLNFTRWDEYSRLRQQRALTGIANQVRDKLMPLPGYLQLHPSAELSDADVQMIFEWAQKERLRLILETAR